MKIRINGNSVRLRLSKTAIAKLGNTGYIEAQTSFGKNKFTYALQCVSEGNELSASFIEGKITVYIPRSMAEGWASNDIIGFDNNSALTTTDSLYLLVEKDFACIDEVAGDQSDNYENPNKAVCNE